MLLLLLILFLNSSNGFVSRTTYGFRAIGAPFHYPSTQFDGWQQQNFVFSSKSKDEITGKSQVDYEYCTVLDDPMPHNPIMASSQFISPEGNSTSYNFIWKCVKTRENGRYSAEPFRCLYKMENGTNKEMMAGESSHTNNGSIRHYCDIANGGLRRVTEYVPGCYHNGSIYTAGEEWSEENPGDKNTSHNVLIGCRREKSGYFEKKALGCLITKFSPMVEHFENGSFIETNETYTYETYMQVNEFTLLSYSENEDREMERCVETEPGHVAVVKATEEDVGCTYKNQFHKYSSFWEDLEMGAVLTCEQFNTVVKSNCLFNGTEYYVNSQHEHKLSNGCTFICHDQKNIYKCPDQLKYMEIMKTTTSRIPTTLRAELGF